MEASMYLRRLSREARWRLPPEEAKEVISDYTELLEGDLRPEKELCRDMGTPRQAVRVLGERNAYCKWLAVFAGLSLCMLLPWAWLLCMEHHPSLSIMLLVLGAAGSMSWFRRGRREARGEKLPLPRGLRPLLAFQALGILAVAACLVIGMNVPLEDVYPASRLGWAMTRILLLAGTLAAAAGLFALVRARLSDRRWCAAYIFGLTATVFCIQILSHMHSMNLDAGLGSWWMSLAGDCAAVVLAGLIMAGVALC